MSKTELQKLLVVGAVIKFGPKYKEFSGDHSADTDTLVQGYFEYDNGLYAETETAPSIYDEEREEFDSIYHMFGNDLENFMDCEVIAALNTTKQQDNG